MTRKGELGCPNCDGPCIGCWEMSDTEKRIAEIEHDCTNCGGTGFLEAGDGGDVKCWYCDGTKKNKDIDWLISELRASQAECEKIEHQRRRLSSCLTGAEADLGVVANERDAARAQLVEAVVLVEWQQTLMEIEASLARADGNTRLAEVLSAESIKFEAFLATVTK